MVIQLLAGNCLPYHQPCPITYNPRKCWSLPGFCSWFEGGVFACTLSWGSYYRPPLFTSSFTRSIWCGRRASTVPPQGMNNQRTLNHSFSHALCPTDFWVWRFIGRLPYQVTSSFRPFQRVENCVDFCFSWQRSHWSYQEWWCFWETCTMTTLADRKDTVKWVTFSAKETTIKWPQCRAILVTKGPWVGFEFHRCLHIQGCFATCGTLTETLSSVQGCSASGGTFAEPLPVGLLPWHWCNPKRSSNNSPDVTFLFHLPLIYWLWYYITARLGAVAFTVLCCELSCR